jgi:hypothetical protein
VLGLLGGAGDASGEGLEEVGGVCCVGGTANANSRLGRMCSRWRQVLHTASSPSSRVMEK